MGWRWIRWLSLIPALIACWYVALIVALLALHVIESFCPPELVISGMCMADWYLAAETAARCFGAGLAALLMVAASAAIAPAEKTFTAALVWFAGGIAAGAIASTTGDYPAFATAVLAGAIGVIFVYRHASAESRT